MKNLPVFVCIANLQIKKITTKTNYIFIKNMRADNCFNDVGQV